MLDRIGDSLGRDEIKNRLKSRFQPVKISGHRHLDRDGTSLSESSDRGRQAGLNQNGRMKAMGQPPKLVQGLPQRLNAPVEHVRCVWIGALECLCLGQLKREEKSHESLLSSVVKISL